MATIKKINDASKESTYTEKEMRELAEFYLNANKSERSDYSKKYEDMLKQVSEESQKITAAGENFIKKEQQAYSARKQQMSEKECIGADEIEKNCPKCGAKLVLRKATKGSNAGRNFYGCSAFPKCRYIENI